MPWSSVKVTEKTARMRITSRRGMWSQSVIQMLYCWSLLCTRVLFWCRRSLGQDYTSSRMPMRCFLRVRHEVSWCRTKFLWSLESSDEPKIARARNKHQTRPALTAKFASIFGVGKQRDANWCETTDRARGGRVDACCKMKHPGNKATHEAPFRDAPRPRYGLLLNWGHALPFRDADAA